MKHDYYVNKEGIKQVDFEEANLHLVYEADEEDHELFINRHNLPVDIFDWEDYPEIAPRLELVSHQDKENTMILIITDVDEKVQGIPMSERLIPITYVWIDDELWCFCRYKHANHIQNLIDSGEEPTSLERFICVTALTCYKNFMTVLKHQEERIEMIEIDSEHQKTDQLLVELTKLEQDLIVLDTVLDLQKDTLQKLMRLDNFVSSLKNDPIVYDLQLYNRQVNHLVHLIHHLNDANSSLMSDLMTNRLNNLMKILSSLSLILAVGSLVGSLWGINTQNLPVAEHPNGSLIVFIFAFVAMIITAIYLKYIDI